MKTRSIFSFRIAVFAALSLIFMSAASFAATGGQSGSGETTSDADDAAKKARQEAIEKVKTQMKELQNYNPAKDSRLKGLSAAEKKKKYIELIKEHERKVAELKKDSLYSADELAADRKSFEEDMGEMDSDAIAQIEAMTDEEFETFLSDAGDDSGGGDDGDEDDDGGDDDGEDEDEKQPSNEPEYNYDREEMSWYEGEGMTKKEIAEERKSLNQKGIDKALKKFSGLEQVLNVSMLANAMNAGAGVIKEIPGWDVTNTEIDSLVSGFNKLVKDARNEALGTIKNPVKINPVKIDLDQTILAMPSSSIDAVLASHKASSLLLAQDGTVLVDDEPETPIEDEEMFSPIILDEASFEDFDWSFGGFRGGNAVIANGAGRGDGPVIDDLRIGNEGLSFSYEEGLSAWGLSDEDAGALACLFVLDNDGNWIGGKFDWISTSRNRRDFKNIYSGYQGWDLSNVPKTTTAAFVIVSADGKKRSNVISAIWKR